MKIIYSPNVTATLNAVDDITEFHEFSGVGFVNVVNMDFYVYEFELLDVGSPGYSQINPELLMPLMEREDAQNIKIWLHKHPMGNGEPGPHNWSSTDVATIWNTPLGGVPKLVRWSLSSVLTPRGWVGRIDDHINEKTEHLSVVGLNDGTPDRKAVKLARKFMRKKRNEKFAAEYIRREDAFSWIEEKAEEIWLDLFG